MEAEGRSSEVDGSLGDVEDGRRYGSVNDADVVFVRAWR